MRKLILLICFMIIAAVGSAQKVVNLGSPAIYRDGYMQVSLFCSSGNIISSGVACSPLIATVGKVDGVKDITLASFQKLTKSGDFAPELVCEEGWGYIVWLEKQKLMWRVYIKSFDGYNARIEYEELH